MNLQRINPPQPGVTVARCDGCGVRVDAGNGYADLDGPAFRAFYCPDCAERLRTAQARPGGDS